MFLIVCLIFIYEKSYVTQPALRFCFCKMLMFILMELINKIDVLVTVPVDSSVGLLALGLMGLSLKCIK